MILLYKDPKKRALQIAELVLLVAILPALLIYGGRSWKLYQDVVASEALFDQAEQKAHQHDWAGSLKLLQECVRVNPRYFPAYEAMADIYFEEDKNLDLAIATLEGALRYAGDDPRVHMALGGYYLRSKKAGDVKKAQQSLEVAMRGMPDNLMCRDLLRRANELASRATL